jgi:hypothetical protein
VGTELRVDLTALGDAASALAKIAGEFDAADSNSQTATSSLGSKGETQRLRHEIESFASSWRARREELKGDVSYLAEMAQLVAETLGDTDKGLAANISANSAPSGLTPSNATAAGGH